LNKKGFTLIEIMIVVAIIALLAAIAIPNFVKYRNRARIGACGANLIQIARAYESYMMENDVEVTSDTGVTATELSSRLVGPTNYLKKFPNCAAGGTYSLTINGTTQVPTSYCSVSDHPSATAAGTQ